MRPGTSSKAAGGGGGSGASAQRAWCLDLPPPLHPFDAASPLRCRERPSQRLQTAPAAVAAACLRNGEGGVGVDLSCCSLCNRHTDPRHQQSDTLPANAPLRLLLLVEKAAALRCSILEGLLRACERCAAIEESVRMA